MWRKKKLIKAPPSAPLTRAATSSEMKLIDLPEELLEHVFNYLAPTTSRSLVDVENYLAASYTSKQFRGIILPLNTLDRMGQWSRG
jgi:hypothetical protein